MSTYTLSELAREARHEVALRHRFYPRWVVEKRMSVSEADRRIALMEAIAEHLAAEAEAEDVKERLL